MRIRPLAAVPIIVAGLALAPVVAAHGPGTRGKCGPTVRNAWVRMAPASMPMGAAFATFENRCAAVSELVAVESPDFASVSLHETRLEDGVSRMRAVRSLRLPARERVELRPGGLHVMLSRPQRELGPGKLVRLHFRFADGRGVTVEAPVRDSAP